MNAIAGITWATNKATEQQLLTHLQECNEDFVPPLDRKVNLADYARKMFQHAVNFEAWDGEHLCGLIAAYFNDPKRGSGFITNVSVTRDQKGKGLASALLNQCIMYARQHGFAQIRLEVLANNAAAITLYRKFHFVNEEEKEDALIMKRVIEQE
jgi:ribosomal protein S18 acetylase RimI-like enzyme